MPSNTDPEMIRMITDQLNRLPDGSGFFTGKMQLSKSHWLFNEKLYGEEGPAHKIVFNDDRLRKEVEKRVTFAVKYSLQICTDYGRDMDFDPDAVVQAVLNVLFEQMEAYSITFTEEKKNVE